MNRRSKLIAAVLAGWIAMSALPIFGDNPPATPDALKPFVSLVDQAKKYQEMTTGMKWATVYDDHFDPGEKPKFVASIPEVTVTDNNNVARQVPTTHFDKVNGENVLVFDTQHLPPDSQECVLSLGPKVSGDFVVEFEGELVNDVPSDLSIFASIHDGPGFQFGGHANTENLITVPSPDAATLKLQHQHTGIASPVGNTPLIEKNRFYKIKLEVKDHDVSGYIDGKLIGHVLMDSRAWDGKMQVQPQIYTWDSIMNIKSARVEAMVLGDKDVDKKAAWTKAFGELKEDEFTKKIDALADLMGDDDQTVRDGAQAMITKLGALAIPSLKTAIANGTAEESQRATVVLDALTQPAAVMPPAPTTQPASAPVEIEVQPIHIEIQMNVNER